MSDDASLLAASCDRAGVPDCVRAVGVRVWPGACQLTLLVPTAVGARTIANLRDNPQIALTFSTVASHRTVQIKGRVLAVRDGDETDRQRALQYRVRFAEALAFVGSPPANTLRLRVWPCTAIDVDITEVFAQTPGPAAGARMPLAGQA